MSLRFFYARAECGEVCMGRLGLVGLVGLVGSEKDLVRAALARSAGSGDPRRARHRNSPLLTPHSSDPTPHIPLLISSLYPLCLCVYPSLSSQQKIAQANRLRWLTCAT